MGTKTNSISINSLMITFESEVINGQVYDTKVYIEGEYFSTISGKDIKDFAIDLKNLLDKYQI